MLITILNNQSQESLPEGISAFDLAKKLHLTSPEQALIAVINNHPCDLATILVEGDRVLFSSFDDPEGKKAFWHTSAHILAQAVKRLYPQALTTIGPPIENGFYYDFANLTLSDSDFESIEKEVKKIIEENAHPQRIEFKTKEEALQAFSENPYKKELIESVSEGSITAYRHGEFLDLCRGPHLSSLSKIKSFKILKTAGAYWKGDAANEMLTRLYAISFPDRQRLVDYLHLVEEAKKRDHKLLGAKLDLFSLKEEAPGMPFIHPKGLFIWNHLLEFLRELLSSAGYVEIKTPLIMTKELWTLSGHWDHYRQNMYSLEIEEREFAIKPMNCPGCMLYYQSEVHSYKEFPLRIAEVGHVHRYEFSGALSGLFRVRGFHQDDAHLFMQPSQIKDEIVRVLQEADTIYSTFGLTYKLELSTRPEKSKTIGSDEEWQQATEGLQGALELWGKPYRINEGDGAFYGPKIDLHIQDALGRFWQCGTVQLDLSLPEKFSLFYVDKDGLHKKPVMIHRALFGSIERFLGVLIEHFAGNFPLWISPLGVQIICVADRHEEYAKELKSLLRKTGVSCEVDHSNESVSKKVRNAQMNKANYMLIIGDEEEEHRTLSLRTRDNKVHGEVQIPVFLEKISAEIRDRSLLPSF